MKHIQSTIMCINFMYFMDFFFFNLQPVGVDRGKFPAAALGDSASGALRCDSYSYVVTPADLQREQDAFEAGEGVSYSLCTYL